jgi:hypothetical protein
LPADLPEGQQTRPQHFGFRPIVSLLPGTILTDALHGIVKIREHGRRKFGASLKRLFKQEFGKVRCPAQVLQIHLRGRTLYIMEETVQFTDYREVVARAFQESKPLLHFGNVGLHLLKKIPYQILSRRLYHLSSPRTYKVAATEII